MEQEILQQIISVVNALNTVTVNGKYNLAQLGGSISVLEKVCEMLQQSTEKEKTQDKKDKNEKG